MFIRLLILFTCIPLLEVYVLIEAGRQIGVMPTISMILLTGAAGAWLARTQGIEVIQRIQRQVAAGEMPGEGLMDGAMVLIGGLLLLTPGFCTDLAGFTFLVPATRGFWRKILTRWVKKSMEQGHVHIRRY